MKRIKYLVCLLLIGALLVPYTVFAENNTEYGYGEGVVSDPLAAKQTSTFSLAATSSLSENEIALLRYLASKIPELNDTIEIPAEYQLSENRFTEIYMQYMGSLMQFEHPEVFYLSDKFGYSYMLDSQHTVTALNVIYKPEYTSGGEADKAKIKAAQDMINTEIENIAAAAENMTDLEKALYVHDYIVANYDYDTRVYSNETGVDGNRTLDKMVAEKTGVCQGYTYLYMVAMKRLGIECIAVPTDELHHVWNKIKLDGKWYNVDVTYDDPISDTITSSSHAYFLVNDDEIKALDPSSGSYSFFAVEGSSAYELSDCSYTINADNTITIVSDGVTVVSNGAIVDYPYVFDGEYGWSAAVKDNSIVALFKITENSCHIRWNGTTWDGKNAEVSTSTQYSYSPLHSIKGVTALAGGRFFCFNAYNDICEIIFENSQQILRERYTLSRDYKWFVKGQHRQYYVNSENNLPYYFSSVAGFDGRLFFNSPNTVYEFDLNTYLATPVYTYETNPDPSETYLYGLRAAENGLKAEYKDDVNGDTVLVSIAVPDAPKPTAEPTAKPTPEPTTEPTPEPTAEPTAEPTPEPTPEVFPEFEEPLPVEKPTVEAAVTEIITDEDTGEKITSYEVTVSVDIPEEVHEAANEASKPVMVSVAKYNEFGAFMGFETVELDSNNQAKFTTDSTCDLIKAFIWAGFIMPLSEANEYQLNQQTPIE